MNPITEYTFYALSFLSILSGLMVIFSRNPVHSVLYLVLTFFTIAGHFLLMSAHFLAAVHVIVYSGAIMVLFLYVIMMLNLNKQPEGWSNFLQGMFWVFPSGLLLITLVGVLRAGSDMMTGAGKNIGTVENNDFLLPFEISSILFLAGMVGAVMVGKKES
jgi:NADH-quinone oxidoreductase subunit J